MSDSIDFNDMINQNRNIYGTQQQKDESKMIHKPVDDSSLTIDNILKGNQAFYNPMSLQTSQLKDKIEEESQDEKVNFFQEVQLLTKIPEIVSFNLIYNYKTIFKNEGIPYEEAKHLDKTRIKRKERELKVSGASVEKDVAPTKKQYVRLYKNQISKICFTAPKSLSLISQHLGNNTKWEKQLKIQDFGGLRPSLSIVQEKTTGRFYIYDNKLGKVHIFSSDMLINDNKDKPLVSLNLNEDKPRQDPLLYLIECEHEYQWKSVLLVIGGHHLQRGEKKPLKTIKVFEIKRREVTLTPVLTITMTKSRMNPIVFDLIKDKGLIWQDKDNGDKEKVDAEHRSVDQKYIFIMGGNPLLEYEKETDQELIEANQTCEYVSLKLILEHIARAKLFSMTDQANLSLNFGKFSIVDTLTIKYQNIIATEKVYNHFYNASVTKMVDDVFKQKALIILGGNTSQTFQIQAISFKLNEITLIGQTKQIQKPSLIYSASNLRYFEKKVFYFDETIKKDPSQLQNMESRRDTKVACNCSIILTLQFKKYIQVINTGQANSKSQNPKFLKFIPIGKYVMKDGTYDFPRAKEAQCSPLALNLFSIDGVTRVFYGMDYISIAKKEDSKWDDLRSKIFEYMFDQFELNQAGSERKFIYEGFKQNQDSIFKEDDSKVIKNLKHRLFK
ncbi:unnamed protein product [Paramecium octaurelia]|uniref:Scaffold protein Nfu/NifU N-terminal domain-containing protein n=1 Tax=Paramecium octaurelia TaxID=43137 RepID=A0A8S1SUK6_PAROT|nr:unnamed protein product [Paramecium octaurelia]